MNLFISIGSFVPSNFREKINEKTKTKNCFRAALWAGFNACIRACAFTLCCNLNYLFVISSKFIWEKNYIILVLPQPKLALTKIIYVLNLFLIFISMRHKEKKQRILFKKKDLKFINTIFRFCQNNGQKI